MTRKTIKSSGFTLAEVVLALAVVAFGLIAVLGVLPIGLNTTRDNRDETMIIQDVEFWMNGIRGGRLSMDALNNVEWVELADESNKTYRADYATIARDSSAFELDGLLLEFPPGPDAEAERAKYIGQLKQAGWRKDVLGWLSVPDTFAIKKRAKIRPLGGTQMNYLNSAKNEEDKYINEAGDLTFAYLLETQISHVTAGMWEIRLRARWPIIEEKFNPETGEMDVKTGPGERTILGYSAAPLEHAWSLVDISGEPEKVGPFWLLPGFLFSSMPPDTKLTMEEISGFLISRLGSVDTESDGGTGFILAPGKIQDEALGEFLGRDESLQELTTMLSDLESNENFMTDLKSLLATHGVHMEEPSQDGEPGQFAGMGGMGGMLAGLNESQVELRAITNELTGLGLPIAPGASVDHLMAQLGTVDGQIKGLDEQFAGLGAGLGLNIDLNALMSPEISGLFNEAINQANQNKGPIMGQLKQGLQRNEAAGNKGITANLSELMGGLDDLNLASREMSELLGGQQLPGAGGGAIPALRQRQAGVAQLSSVKKRLGVETMEGVRNKLEKLSQNDKLNGDIGILLVKSGLTRDNLEHLFASHKLKTQINTKLIAPLLGQALPKLLSAGYLRRVTIGGRSYYLKGISYDSFGRYALMHTPRSLDEYFEYNEGHPLTDEEDEIWKNIADQVIQVNTFEFEKIIKEGAMWDMRKFLWGISGEFNTKLDEDNSFPEGIRKGSGDYFRQTQFFRPLLGNH